MRQLIEDVADRPRAVRREDPVRAVGAELRTAAAGEQRKRPARGTRRERQLEPPPIVRHEVPSREREGVQVIHGRAVHDAVERLALEETRERGLRFPRDDEVRRRSKQLRQLGRGQADEPDTRAARAHLLRPHRLAPVIDERRQDNREVGIDERALRRHHLVSRARRQRGDIRQLDAWQVVEVPLEGANHRRDTTERSKTRAIAARHGVLADKPVGGLQISQNDTHEVPSVS